MPDETRDGTRLVRYLPDATPLCGVYRCVLCYGCFNVEPEPAFCPLCGRKVVECERSDRPAAPPS